MAKKYLIIKETHYPKGNGRFSPCSYCEKEFEDHEKRTMIEIQWDYFRGNDTVETYHTKCLRTKKREVRMRNE